MKVMLAIVNRADVEEITKSKAGIEEGINKLEQEAAIMKRASKMRSLGRGGKLNST